MSQLREVVESVAKSLVDNPNGVNVVEIEGEKTIVIELRVDKGDIGKVIGSRAGSPEPSGLSYPPWVGKPTRGWSWKY
jgi:RNA-binding protein (KH domain)